ncbi:cell division protein FtsQ/DivIB [Paenisporosarcina sp. TG20]|uniref:cell division protein FtsQ/DivIB n=1 Tax=Paenisporosarcina sp. TG20 TaxID=1211706 RepID=UPI00035EAF41|nr:FtsQ-type POTRA domain-containing protein [Paenisporosarcina sp. TG20]
MDKIIDIEDRIPTLRESRKKRTNRKFTLLLVIFLLTLISLLYFQSPYSHIQTIIVKGANLSTSEEYIEQSGLQQGQSMWEFRTSSAEKKMKKKEWIQDVIVRRSGLTTVTIEVGEWKKAAYIESDNKGLELVLENGLVFQTLETMPLVNAPLLSNFDNPKVTNLMVKELAKLNQEVLTMISQIESVPSEADPYRIRLFMNDGYEVRAIIPTFAEKMNYYPSIIAQIDDAGKGVIDIEVGSFFQTYSELYNPQLEEEENEASE